MNIHLVIHLDPVVTDDARTTKLKEQVIHLLEELSEQISMHDFRVVWGTTHTNVIFDVCVPFDFQWSDSELIQRISQGISRLDPTYFTVLTVDHDYVPHLAKNEIPTNENRLVYPESDIPAALECPILV